MAEHEEASSEIMRVAFASDINPLLAEAFLDEAPVHAGRLSEIVARLSGDGARLEDVILAQRVAHSLKGSASITGVAAITDVTHQAEDIFDWLVDSGQLPPVELREMLVDTADCVAAMVDALSVQGPAPPSTARVLTRLRQWREENILDVATAAPASTTAGVNEELANDRVPEPKALEGTAPLSRTAASLRVPVADIDRLMRLAGELATTNVQAQGAQDRMKSRANLLREQYHLLQLRLEDLQDVIELRSVPSRSGRPFSSPVAGVDGFDSLELDQYDELHSKNTALAEAVTDFCEMALGMRIDLSKMEDTGADRQRISKEISASVLSARMVPIGNLEQRLQRAVRETCRETEKQATLGIMGGDIPVDGDVLNALVDPLLHLLRNAIDHGIETSEVREAAGKGAIGNLIVHFTRDGENILIQVRDDGAGFDLDGIRDVARQRGIMADEDIRMERELLQMTVGAGFSTRSEVTHVSGRGIGMDIVHRAVLDLKGNLDIASMPGAGSTISLRVPFTLIAMHVLLVRVGTQIFGVPGGSLRKVLITERSALRNEQGKVKLVLDDYEYDLCHLETLVGGASDVAKERNLFPVLLLDADSGPLAIVVDEVVDGRSLVVNNLGPTVPRAPGVIGASVVGDSSVAPVLDLRELLRLYANVQNDVLELEVQVEEVPHETRQTLAPEVLVVEDSLTARRMLALSIGDAGYRVRTAIDGIDAVEAIEDAMPDMVITDLEMPRMNGLELAARLRDDPLTAQLPILMVTSRSTEKHRGQAQAAGISHFITKPYSNQELMEKVVELLGVSGKGAY